MASLDRTYTIKDPPRAVATIKIKVARRVRWRYWMAGRLINAAGWLMNAEIFVIDYGDK